MKKFLLSSVALLGLTAGAMAADLPSRRVAPAPAIAAVPVFTWTGFYVGAQVGYGWSDNEHHFDGYVFDVDGDGDYDDAFDIDDDDGFLFGAHVGYNFQFGSVVFGVEGDLEGVFGDDDDDFTTLRVRTVGGTTDVDYVIANGGLDWLGSLRARLGFAFDRVLVYGTGGFAFGGVSDGFSSLVDDDDDETLTGWTIGAGVEYAITNNLTTRLEYRYTNFDSVETRFGTVDVGGDDLDFHTVRAGVSFKF